MKTTKHAVFNICKFIALTAVVFVCCMLLGTKESTFRNASAGEKEKAAKKDGKAAKRACLTGVVHFQNGSPVPGGTIRLDFGKKGIAAAGLDAKGAFYFGNLPVGKARVAIETESVKERHLPLRFGKLSAQAKKLKEKLDKTVKELRGGKTRYVPIPKKYTEFKKSGLTIAVRAGKNHQTFIVKKK